MQPATDPALTDTARGLLAEIGESTLSGLAIVCWNPRMRSAAGRAWLEECRIDINPRLTAISRDEIDRTLRHELAHLLAHHRAGNRPIRAHGAEWRQACCDLGIPGEKATHRLPLPMRRQRRKHAYQCRGCGRVVRRVREIRRPTACGRCCRERNSGRFCESFILEKIPLLSQAEASREVDGCLARGTGR